MPLTVRSLVTALLAHRRTPSPAQHHAHRCRAAADAKRLAALTAIEPGLTHDDYIELTATIAKPDLRQDAMVALLEAQPDTEAEARTVIARTRYRADWSRSQDRKRYQSLPDVEIAAEEHVQPMTGPLYDAVCRLPLNQRNAILLTVVGDMSVTEAAAELSVSRQTVHKWIKAAKATLTTQSPM